LVHRPEEHLLPLSPFSSNSGYHAGLPRLTPRTLVSRQVLVAELDLVRRQGFAVDNEENEADGRCTGAPIVGQGGRIGNGARLPCPLCPKKHQARETSCSMARRA